MRYWNSSGHGTILRICLLASLSLATGGCPMCDGDGGPPNISFTFVPPYGSFENLRGETNGVSSPTHRVVVYIRVDDTWWVKPTEADPLTAIDAMCRWEVDITTGGVDHEAVEIRAFVVPADFAPQINTLPPDSIVVASASTTRQPTIHMMEVGYIGSPTELRGNASDIDPGLYRVVAYVLIDDRWWVKPTDAEALTVINDDGSWVVDITTASTDTSATRVWVGIVREDLSVSRNYLPDAENVIASECLARGAGEEDRLVACEVEDMFDFIEEQLTEAGNDPIAGGLPSAFSTSGALGLPQEFMSYAENHAMVYDASVAAIAMAKLTPRRRESLIRQIADALVFAIRNDPASDGRIRDGYYSNDIRAPEPNRDSPSIRNGETHVGNVAWAIMALCHAYTAVSDETYVSAAEQLGGWIEAEMRAEDTLGGYYGGLLFRSDVTDYSDENLERVEWRSVEYNADLASAFQALVDLTSQQVWSERADHARRFVEASSMYDCGEELWYLGTTMGTEVNTWPLAEDTAVWPWLADIRPCGDSPLTWALSTLGTVSNGFYGIRFSNVGDGVVSESTAHLALALQLAGREESAAELLDSLQLIKTSAPNADGKAVVAAPVIGNGVSTGLGEYYYAAPHVASTAWAILAATAGNPFQLTEAR